jgi:hypothetical protein
MIMTDKERIFQQIIGFTLNPEFKTETSVFWEYVNSETVLVKGDIIAGCTNQNHDFSICFFVEKISKYELIVQEIGSKRITRYHNEMFKVLRNFPSLHKLTGEEWKFRLKVGKVINQNYWSFALCETSFNEKEITFTFRKKFFSELKDFKITYEGSLSKLSQIKIKSLLDDSGILNWH